MDEKLRDAIAIVLSDELEPDRINELVDTGLEDHQAAFDEREIPKGVRQELVELFDRAQGRNGSRGWISTYDKYLPTYEGRPRCSFTEDGEVVVSD